VSLLFNLETICPTIWAKPLQRDCKRHLPVLVRGPKAPLLKALLRSVAKNSPDYQEKLKGWI